MMNRVLTAIFSLGLLTLFPAPSNGGYAVSAEDYGCLWWAHGTPYYHDYRALPADNIPKDYPGKKQVLCLHTGRYGMAIDTINLNRINLGRFKDLVDRAADLRDQVVVDAGDGHGSVDAKCVASVAVVTVPLKMNGFDEPPFT